MFPFGSGDHSGRRAASLSGGAGENPFLGLFQLPEAICPGLAAPSSVTPLSFDLRALPPEKTLVVTLRCAQVTQDNVFVTGPLVMSAKCLFCMRLHTQVLRFRAPLGGQLSSLPPTPFRTRFLIWEIGWGPPWGAPCLLCPQKLAIGKGQGQPKGPVLVLRCHCSVTSSKILGPLVPLWPHR